MRKAYVNIDMIFFELEILNCQAGMQSKCKKKTTPNPSHFSVNNITNTFATPGRLVGYTFYKIVLL